MPCRERRSRKHLSLIPNLSDLEERGRLHFFYHSPSSELPVRDVLDQQGEGNKTEPYIEKSAENYCEECNQANIRGFLASKERYLFLFTTCRISGSCHDGKIFVVGYIRKERFELRPRGFLAVIGPVRIFSFDDAYPLGKSSPTNNPRQLPKRLDRTRTRRILDHFEGSTNILGLCRAEVERLKKQLRGRDSKRKVRLCR
jgi:hypothetical protein